MPAPPPLHIQMESNAPEETFSLGEKIGGRIRLPTLITLCGDLGSGKTVFVQGLAKGLDVPEEYYITSPTYMLMNEYPGRLPLFHFDFYRLENADDIHDIGFYERLGAVAVIAVEWADRLDEDVNMDHLALTIDILGDHSRKITITANGPEPVRLIQESQ